MLLNVIFLFKPHFQRILFGSCTNALHQFGVRFQQHQQLSDWAVMKGMPMALQSANLGMCQGVLRGWSHWWGAALHVPAKPCPTRLATPILGWFWDIRLTNLRLLPAMQLSCRFSLQFWEARTLRKTPKVLWYSTLPIYRYSSQLCRLRSPDPTAPRSKCVTWLSPQPGDSRHRDASAPLQNSWVTGTRTFKIVAQFNRCKYTTEILCVWKSITLW